jgi:hypothetical protein
VFYAFLFEGETPLRGSRCKPMKKRNYIKKDIAEIRLVNINDSNQNGAGIGTLIGAAPLAIFALAYGAKEVNNEEMLNRT